MRKVISGKYQQKASVAILILDKTNKQTKSYWYKEDHSIMLNGTLNLEGIILI